MAATSTWGRGARITLSNSPCQEGGQGCAGGSVCEEVTAVGMNTNKKDSVPLRVDCAALGSVCFNRTRGKENDWL